MAAKVKSQTVPALQLAKKMAEGITELLSESISTRALRSSVAVKLEREILSVLKHANSQHFSGEKIKQEMIRVLPNILVQSDLKKLSRGKFSGIETVVDKSATLGRKYKRIVVNYYDNQKFGVPVDQFTESQKAIAEMYGVSPSDVTPSFIKQKKEEAEERVKIRLAKYEQEHGIKLEPNTPENRAKASKIAQKVLSSGSLD